MGHTSRAVRRYPEWDLAARGVAVRSPEGGTWLTIAALGGASQGWDLAHDRASAGGCAGGWDFAHDVRGASGALRDIWASVPALAPARVGLRSRRRDGPGRACPIARLPHAATPSGAELLRRSASERATRRGWDFGHNRRRRLCGAKVGLRSRCRACVEGGLSLTALGAEVGAFAQWDCAHGRVGRRSRCGLERGRAIRGGL
jgi:hypothetical protein